MSQRKTGALGLTAQGYRDHGSGTLVEDVVAEYQNRTQTRLFVPPDRIQVRPANLPPQYSGHVSSSRPRPSSATAFSDFGSSLAHSDASRLRSIRVSFSATASLIARLRLGNTFLETRPSTRCSVCRSMVIATFTLLMRILLGMTIYHTHGMQSKLPRGAGYNTQSHEKQKVALITGITGQDGAYLAEF